MKGVQQNRIKAKYMLLYGRVARAMETGRFMQYTRAKREALKNRLERYERRLKEWGIAVASAAALFGMPMTAQGQLAFTQQTDADNPLDGFNNANGFSGPAFVDIDADGDMDLFAGTGFGGDFVYYENTGTALAAQFTERTGAANPLDGELVASNIFSRPAFVDMDGDGDMDLVAGGYAGEIEYWENTGTTLAPQFTKRTGAANPLDGAGTGVIMPTPTFGDLDGDGDMDLLTGNFLGTFRYYENTGTALAPQFTERTGSANPMDGESVVPMGMVFNGVSAPAFVDLDRDGDLDIVTGETYGSFKYYENTGTPSVPQFVERTGAANPLDAFTTNSTSSPTFVDIDGDGDKDMFAGWQYPTLFFYENTSPVLPVELLRFEGEAVGAVNALTWATATEENNAGFDVQRSMNGSDFETIGWTPGAGTTQERHHYRFEDRDAPSGVAYYRLKQVDFDGAHEYSRVITIRRKAATTAPSIFPNPVTDHLTIQQAAGSVVTIYNALGQPVQAFELTQSPYTIDVSALPAGQYLLRIITDAGATYTQQLVK